MSDVEMVDADMMDVDNDSGWWAADSWWGAEWAADAWWDAAWSGGTWWATEWSGGSWWDWRGGGGDWWATSSVAWWDAEREPEGEDAEWEPEGEDAVAWEGPDGEEQKVQEED